MLEKTWLFFGGQPLGFGLYDSNDLNFPASLINVLDSKRLVFHNKLFTSQLNTLTLIFPKYVINSLNSIMMMKWSHVLSQSESVFGVVRIFFLFN